MTYQEALHYLEPYTEVLDTNQLDRNQLTLESRPSDERTPLEHLALGITYHEQCVMNYLLAKKTSYGHYAQKSLDMLREAAKTAPVEAKPIVDAYIVSARSLVASVKKNLIELIRVIRQYDVLIKRDGEFCYCAAFLQAGLLENMPNVFGAHKKAARRFSAIIEQQKRDPSYCSNKIISFCYLGLARFERDASKKKALLQQSLAADTNKDGATPLASQLLQSLGG